MKHFHIFSALFLLAVNVSCKKNGTGGNADVNTKASHHNRPIPFTDIYIKYNATEFPGGDISAYDATQKSDKDAKSTFKGLLPGDYYFYGVGYDSSAQAVVKGGVGLTIRRSDRKKSFELNISITE